ncbi:hypothetical protein Dimus_011452 [Dionaea muscipula]
MNHTLIHNNLLAPAKYERGYTHGFVHLCCFNSRFLPENFNLPPPLVVALSRASAQASQGPSSEILRIFLFHIEKNLIKFSLGVESREGCTSSKTVDYIAVKQARREDNSLHSHKEQNVLLKGIVDGGKLWHQSPQCNSLRWE